MFARKNKNKAFTLIELLVVIVIIGILATISVATFQGYFEKARLAKAQQAYNQIKSLIFSQNASTEKNLITARYTFDGNTLNTTSSPYALDTSGTGNNLTNITSSGSFSQSNDTPLGIGKSLRITSKRIYKNGNFINEAINKVTLAAWIKVTDYTHSAATYPVWLNHGAGLAISQNGVVTFFINNRANAVRSQPKSVVPDKWYYIVASYDGDTLKLWIDGNLISSESGVTQTVDFKGQGFVLGQIYTTPYFDGWLDDVMYMPYAFDGEKFK